MCSSVCQHSNRHEMFFNIVFKMIASRFIHRIFKIKFVSKFKSVQTVHDCNKYISYIGVIHFEYSKLTADIEGSTNLFSSIHYNQLFIDQRRFYSKIDRKNLNFNIEKSKQLLKDNIELKRLKMRERTETLVQGIRDKQTKVQQKVRTMEEIVERENILTIPNLLCVTRSFLAPYIGYVIIQEQYQLAIGLLFFAGLTDILDGFIARIWVSQASKLGSFLDPMADKLLVGSLVVSLSYCNLFPAWLGVMIISRDFFLIIAGFVIRYISLPPPRTLQRYFDATHVTAKLKPTLISKVNTAVQLTTIAASLANPVYGLLTQATLVSMWYFTGFTTMAAATSYIFSKDTYQLIKNRKKEKTF